MKKLETIRIETLTGGGSGCDFTSGLLSGWGAAGVFAGGVAASTGIGLLVIGLAIGLYCSK